MYRIVFMGSGDLGYGVLTGLLESNHQIVGVLPWESLSKTTWRTRLKRKLLSDISTLADKSQLPKLRPCRANTAEFAQQINELAPDLFVVAGWGEIFKPSTIALAKVACVNVHPSLLPRHRGSNPISSVLRAGEAETGVTFHLLTAAIDAGGIVLQSPVAVSRDDNGDSLRRKLSFRAKEMVVQALAQLAAPEFAPVPQDESVAFYHRRFQPPDAQIHWAQPAAVIHNHVRGCFPWFPSFTHHRGKKLLVLRGKLVDLHLSAAAPGQILFKIGAQVVVATGDPKRGLLISKFRLPGALGSVKGRLYVLRSLRVGDFIGAKD